jgi:hypothetical protein
VFDGRMDVVSGLKDSIIINLYHLRESNVEVYKFQADIETEIGFLHTCS